MNAHRGGYNPTRNTEFKSGLGYGSEDNRNYVEDHRGCGNSSDLDHSGYAFVSFEHQINHIGPGKFENPTWATFYFAFNDTNTVALRNIRPYIFHNLAISKLLGNDPDYHYLKLILEYIDQYA